jgi:hypothetical protein
MSSFFRRLWGGKPKTEDTNEHDAAGDDVRKVLIPETGSESSAQCTQITCAKHAATPGFNPPGSTLSLGRRPKYTPFPPKRKAEDPDIDGRNAKRLKDRQPEVDQVLPSATGRRSGGPKEPGKRSTVDEAPASNIKARPSFEVTENTSSGFEAEPSFNAGQSEVRRLPSTNDLKPAHEPKEWKRRSPFDEVSNIDHKKTKRSPEIHEEKSSGFDADAALDVVSTKEDMPDDGSCASLGNDASHQEEDEAEPSEDSETEDGDVPDASVPSSLGNQTTYLRRGTSLHLGVLNHSSTMLRLGAVAYVYSERGLQNCRHLLAPSASEQHLKLAHPSRATARRLNRAALTSPAGLLVLKKPMYDEADREDRDRRQVRHLELPPLYASSGARGVVPMKASKTKMLISKVQPKKGKSGQRAIQGCWDRSVGYEMGPTVWTD